RCKGCCTILAPSGPSISPWHCCWWLRCTLSRRTCWHWPELPASAAGTRRPVAGHIFHALAATSIPAPPARSRPARHRQRGWLHTARRLAATRHLLAGNRTAALVARAARRHADLRPALARRRQGACLVLAASAGRCAHGAVSAWRALEPERQRLPHGKLDAHGLFGAGHRLPGVWQIHAPVAFRRNRQRRRRGGPAGTGAPPAGSGP